MRWSRTPASANLRPRSCIVISRESAAGLTCRWQTHYPAALCPHDLVQRRRGRPSGDDARALRYKGGAEPLRLAPGLPVGICAVPGVKDRGDAQAGFILMRPANASAFGESKGAVRSAGISPDFDAARVLGEREHPDAVQIKQEHGPPARDPAVAVSLFVPWDVRRGRP